MFSSKKWNTQQQLRIRIRNGTCRDVFCRRNGLVFFGVHSQSNRLQANRAGICARSGGNPIWIQAKTTKDKVIYAKMSKTSKDLTKLSHANQTILVPRMSGMIWNNGSTHETYIATYTRIWTTSTSLTVSVTVSHSITDQRFAWAESARLMNVNGETAPETVWGIAALLGFEW